MNKTRKQETDRFQAATDEGEVFTIVEITNQTAFTPLATGVTKWVDSLKEYQAVGSGAVNKIGETDFEILSEDKIVKRV